MNLSTQLHAPPILTALTYSRISSVKQSVEGSGLQSQQHRCEAYAAARGYIVEKNFLESVSGGLEISERPAMKELLAYLSQQKNSGKNYVVIFDDHKRFARNTSVHISLHKEIKKRGAKVEYLNFSIEDTPEGTFIDTMLAAQSQLEREQIGRQTREKTIARLERGFWTFRAPIGYKYVKSKQGGKELVLDEPVASVIKEGFKGFAHGLFGSQAELVRFFEASPHFPKDGPNDSVRKQTVSRMLDKVLYAGYLEAPNYGVSLRKAQHKALIDFETFEKIQKCRKENSYLPKRKDLHTDFPLRGAVHCASCEKPLRSGWTKGNTKYHAYYLCQTKGCADYGKSIRKADIEGDFVDVLKTIQPANNYVHMIKDMFKDAWTIKSEQAKDEARIFTDQANKIEAEIDVLLSRIISASNERVIEAYENKIAELEKKKTVLQEKTSQMPLKKKSYSEILELSLTFLVNPYKLWEKGGYDIKRTVLKLAFNGPLYYTRKKGARTPIKPFKHRGFNPIIQGQFHNGAGERT